jgi:hypothetical protein
MQRAAGLGSALITPSEEPFVGQMSDVEEARRIRFQACEVANVWPVGDQEPLKLIPLRSEMNSR